jgi:hypothetical protein
MTQFYLISINFVFSIHFNLDYFLKQSGTKSARDISPLSGLSPKIGEECSPYCVVICVGTNCYLRSQQVSYTKQQTALMECMCITFPIFVNAPTGRR